MKPVVDDSTFAQSSWVDHVGEEEEILWWKSELVESLIQADE